MDGNSGRFTYYGFTNAIEREFFEALFTVCVDRSAFRSAGVLAADVGDRRGDRSRRLRLSQDAAGHRAAKGARHRREAAGQGDEVLAHPRRAAARPIAIPDFAAEALAVLLQLGYHRAEAEAMIRETLERKPDIDQAEGLLAEIYRRKAAKDAS